MPVQPLLVATHCLERPGNMNTCSYQAYCSSWTEAAALELFCWGELSTKQKGGGHPHGGGGMEEAVVERHSELPPL